MSINYLPIDNSIALVTSAVTDALTGNAITDATITAEVLTVADVSLCSAAMTHDAGGIYKGTLDLSTASTDLVLNTHYYLQLSASNYALVWKRLLRAEDRPLVGSGSVSIDLTPGTSGLPALTGIPKGDGTGTYVAGTPGTDYAKPDNSTVNGASIFAALYAGAASVSTNAPAIASFKTRSGAIADHAFHCQETVNATLDSTGYSMFADQITVNISSGKTMGHVNEVQFQNCVVNGLGTLGTRTGLDIADSSGTATITNQFGVFCADLTHGSTLNYAFWTAENANGIVTTRSNFGPITIGGDTLLQTTALTTGVTLWAKHDGGVSALRIIDRGVPTPANSDPSKYYSGAVGYGGTITLEGLTSDFNIIAFARLEGYNVSGGTSKFGLLRLMASDVSGNPQTGLQIYGDKTAVFLGDVQFPAGFGMKMPGTAVATEGYIWYDYSTHQIKYRDNAGIKTITGIT